MKKIKLNETDLIKIVKRVLNEQKDRQFNEDEIDILHFIFERELKPPFRNGEKTDYGNYPYYNRDGEEIGWLESDEAFTMRYTPCFINIKYKVCQVFGFSHENRDWWDIIKPHLKSWLEDQLNIELHNIWKI